MLRQNKGFGRQGVACEIGFVARRGRIMCGEETRRPNAIVQLAQIGGARQDVVARIERFLSERPSSARSSQVLGLICIRPRAPP